MIQQLIITSCACRREFPSFVFDLTINEVVCSGFEVIVSLLFQIQEHVSRAQEVRSRANADAVTFA
ncbi:hypothetical protein D3C87_1733040 [compost metagenome]